MLVQRSRPNHRVRVRRSLATCARRVFLSVVAFALVLYSTASWSTATATQLARGSVVHNSLAIATALSLSSKDLPAGWTSDGQGGRCIAGKASNPAAPYCGTTPLPGQMASEKAFARCVGVPIAHISMLIGQDELGEPFTYSSSTYTAPGGPGANPDLLPQAQTYLSIEPSVAAQTTDLKAFSKAGFPRCFEIEESGPLFAVIKGFAHALDGHFSVGPLKHVPIPSTSDVNSVGYYVVMDLRARSFSGSETLQMAIMGAGHIEEVLILQSWSNSPLPAKVSANIVIDLETGLTRFARTI